MKDANTSVALLDPRWEPVSAAGPWRSRPVTAPERDVAVTEQSWLSSDAEETVRGGVFSRRPSCSPPTGGLSPFP